MPIVLATDFSHASRQAADVAAALAVRANTPLHLIHATPPQLFPDLASAARSALEREKERLRPSGARITVSHLEGKPEETLVRYAVHHHADLVILGGPPHSSTFLGFGGTVDRMVRSLPLPALVVRDTAALEAWAAGTRPLRVLLGLDRSLGSSAAMNWLNRLGALGPVEVTAVHLFWPSAEYARLGLKAPLVMTEVTPELGQALEVEVQRMAAPLQSLERVVTRCQSAFGRMADHLVEAAVDARADLLVVGCHHRGGMERLWSVSHHALRLAPMSVVCVPAEAVPARSSADVPQIERVLVATDLSELANRAVPFAVGALPERGQLVVMVVTGERLSPGDREALERRLARLVPETATAREISVVAEVVEGRAEPAAAIVQAAERHDVDLVCLGTHGRGGIARTVLGSVALAVVKQSHRPVMLVPRPAGS